MLFFLLFKKWKTYFSIRHNWDVISIHFLLLSFLILIAFITGKVYDLSVKHDINVAASYLPISINYFLLLFPIIIKFFPSIASRSLIVHKVYPLTKRDMVFFEILFTIFSKLWIYFLFIFCIILFVSSNFFNLFQTITAILTGICGILFAENFINAFHHNKKHYFICVFLCLIINLFCLKQTANIEHTFFVTIAIALLLIVLYYLFYKPFEIIILPTTINLFSSSKNLFFKILIRNSKHRTAILFSLIMQTIFTYLFFINLITIVPVSKFYMCSFVVLFAYCYNNMWGFFPSIALNMYIAGSTMKNFISVFIRLLLPAILITIILFGIFFYLFPKFITFHFFIGFASLMLFIFVNGVIFSFVKMKKISTPISFNAYNQNTNLIPMYLFSLVSLGLGFIEKEGNYFLLFTLLIIVFSVIQITILYLKSSFFLTKFIRKII